jgi:chorismate mutase/prephenate dehydratase
MALFLLLAISMFAQTTDLNGALDASRRRIDSIDEQVVKLLNERAQVVREVGLIKKKYNAAASAPSREQQVIQRAAARAQAPLTPSAVEAIYKTILHEMSSMEAAEMEKNAKAQ